MWISLKDVYIIHEIKLWLFCFMYRMYNHEFEAIFFKVIYLSIVLFIYFSGGQSIVVFNYENRLFQKKKKKTTRTDAMSPYGLVLPQQSVMFLILSSLQELQIHSKCPIKGMVSFGGEASAASMTQIIFHVKLELVATKFSNDQ